MFNSLRIGGYASLIAPSAKKANLAASPHFGSQRTYLMTLQELYAASIGNLGPMDKPGYSFERFTQEAKQLAATQGIQNPLLVIDISLKQPSGFGATEQPYPISRDEWDVFKSDALTMANFMPNVHVVDGDKYTAPI